jgi:heat shock protein HslJ
LPLVGTWRLLKFQSMDDAVGTLTPEADQPYTMTLDADGAAQFVLNCNRASGTYTSTASSETSGQLEFGPVAMTRALCPPPSLDERIAADLGFVRSYLLKDGRLHLSLMADGGIYSFEPAIGD